MVAANLEIEADVLGSNSVTHKLFGTRLLGHQGVAKTSHVGDIPSADVGKPETHCQEILTCQLLGGSAGSSEFLCCQCNSALRTWR